MKVFCSVDYTELENERGHRVPGVVITCDRCGHQTESFGQQVNSVKRCMILLKEECPNGERNFYDEGTVTNTSQSWRKPAAAAAPQPVGAAATTATGALFSLFGDMPDLVPTPEAIPAPESSLPAPAAPASAPTTRRKFSAPRGKTTSTRPADSAPSAPAGIAPAAPTMNHVPSLIAKNDFCIVKCATTGLSTEKDEIVQIGLCQVDKGSPKWRISVNVKPSVPVSPRAGQIHGLTADRLVYAPSFSEIALELVEFIGSRILLGYNIGKFDVPILTRQLGAALGPVEDPAHLDVLLFERKYAQEQFAVNEKQRHGLEDAARRWGVPLEVTHDALNDAKVVWAVFVQLCSRFPELGDTDLAGAYEILKSEGALTAMGLRTAAKFAHLR